MTKSALGKKHLCPKCEKRFYDLNSSPAVCPKCGTKIEPPKRSGSRRSDVRHAITPSVAKDQPSDTLPDEASDVSADEELEIDDENGVIQQVESGDEQENVIGDTSDIGGVDDGMSEALEHIDEAVVD